jgi:hypothetical protein
MDPRLTHGATVRGKRQGHSLSRARAHSRYVTFLGTNSAVGTKLGTSRLVNQRDSTRSGCASTRDWRADHGCLQR